MTLLNLVLYPDPSPYLKNTQPGRGSGGMTRFLTDLRRNAGVHSIAIPLPLYLLVVNELHTTYEYCYCMELYRSGKENDIAYIMYYMLSASISHSTVVLCI